MNIVINEKILRQTNCPNKFCCLSGNMHGVCEIFYSEREHFVSDCAKRDCDCEYCKPLDSHAGHCTCPTRLELYKRHGI